MRKIPSSLPCNRRWSTITYVKTTPNSKCTNSSKKLLEFKNIIPNLDTEGERQGWLFLSFLVTNTHPSFYSWPHSHLLAPWMSLSLFKGQTDQQLSMGTHFSNMPIFAEKINPCSRAAFWHLQAHILTFAQDDVKNDMETLLCNSAFKTYLLLSATRQGPEAWRTVCSMWGTGRYTPWWSWSDQSTIALWKKHERLITRDITKECHDGVSKHNKNS